jgi:hypothetical protein
MLAFGCPITDQEIYEILAYASAGSIFRSYNVILDQVSDGDGLEALVLVHQDAEIVDPDFCRKIREALSDPDVAIVGAAGAVGVRGIAYWEGSVTWASFTHRYSELGGGEFPALTWDLTKLPAYARMGEVETIDGFVIVMSPWAVRELRFDESLGQLHGYDFDICAQARAAGKKVVTADLRTVHHHSLKLLNDRETWIEAHIKIHEKWDGKLPGVAVAPGDWKQRSRRAEAEASVARLHARSVGLVRDAKVAKLERELAIMRNSTSWRMTAPLRWLGDAARRLLRLGRSKPAAGPVPHKVGSPRPTDVVPDFPTPDPSPDSRARA